MVATAAIRVGPVSAKFGGKVSLSDLNPPVSYRITGEGQGGVAGFAKGSADIRLDEIEGGTMLNYSVDAQVGGKLAQLGGRLIDATARKMSEAFFEKFASEIRRQYHAEGQPASAGSPAVAPPSGGPATPSATPARAPLPAAGSYAHQPPASRAPFFAALALAAAFAFLWLADRTGVPVPAMPTPTLSPEFSAAVQLLLVAAVGFLFGRSSERRQ